MSNSDDYFHPSVSVEHYSDQVYRCNNCPFQFPFRHFHSCMLNLNYDNAGAVADAVVGNIDPSFAVAVGSSCSIHWII